jgi:predicted Fe-S protein YdhL (DUF1289 family)
LFTGVGRVSGYSFVRGLLYPCLGFCSVDAGGHLLDGKEEEVLNWGDETRGRRRKDWDMTQGNGMNKS